jgi:hypothetical protein
VITSTPSQPATAPSTSTGELVAGRAVRAAPGPEGLGVERRGASAAGLGRATCVVTIQATGYDDTHGRTSL